MEFMISGRNLTVSDRFREYAGEKISKIESLGDKVQRVDAKVSKETNARQTGDQLTVEVTVLGRGPVIRAEASAADAALAASCVVVPYRPPRCSLRSRRIQRTVKRRW